MAGESADASARRMRSKAQRLERAADLWERGAAGERITAELLATLPSTGWTVFHDLRWPGRKFANVDHVAVGPGGVFVIDSKNWTGSITARQGVLRQNGRLRQPAVTAAGDAARALARVATSTSPTHVHPVLCFVGDDAVVGRAGEVLLSSPANLLTLLQTRPPVLTEDARVAVCRDIDAFVSTAAAAPLTPAPRRQRSRPRASTKPSRPGPKVGREVSRLVGVVVGGAALLMLVTSGVPAQIAELLTSLTVSDAGDEAPDTDQPKDEKKSPPTRPRDQKPSQVNRD